MSSLPPLAEVAAQLRARTVSPVELTRLCLSRIERLDPPLRSFVTVTAERALAQARVAETEIQTGRYRGPLHGVPIAIKDLIDTAGVRTTAASDLFADRVPGEDAEVVRRLDAAGAVFLGKLNLHEFAYGGSGVVSRFGPARNPRSPAHIAGGSSSGSGAAVAAGLCFAALGTDTSGSIRVPASFCGIVGLKPTYGLVSVRGVLPLAASLDHVGPMAQTAVDAALVLQAIAGPDREDIFSVEMPVPDYAGALAGDGRPARVGVAREYFFDGIDAEVAAAVDAALAAVERLGARLREICVPVDEDRTVFLAESHAVHHRWIAESPERYQPETLRRIRVGAEVSAADYIEGRHRLQRIRRRAAALFDDVDVIATPTVPVPPPSFAELEADPSRLRARELAILRNTRPFNVLGTPALSLPCGSTRAGLPIGLQLVGRPGGEADVLRIAAAFERALVNGWHAPC